MEKTFIWVEDYKPRSLKDIILDGDIKNKLNKFNSNNIQHLIFHGNCGTGKTTIAKCLCTDLNMEYLFVNASLDNNLDNIRTNIKNFAQTISFNNNKKAVILDEIDATNNSNFFLALRPIIEEFQHNCIFLMTCNRLEIIPDAIVSRAFPIEIKLYNKQEYAMDILRRLQYILKEESIEYDNKVLAEIIKKHLPDIRSIINFCQLNSHKLNDLNFVTSMLQNDEIVELIKYLIKKDYNSIRTIIINNLNITSNLYTQLYQNIKSYLLDDESYSNAILIIDDYMRSNHLALDKEIHLIAMMIELSRSCKFKV